MQDLPTRMSSVVISSQQDCGLAVTTPDANLLRVILYDSVSISSLGVPVSANRHDGSQPYWIGGRVLRFATRNRIRVIAGLPSAAALAREFDLCDFLGTLTSVAISGRRGLGAGRFL